MRSLIVSWMLCIVLLAATFGWAAHVWAQGSIRLGTPITFAAPSSITDWDPVLLALRPGTAASITIEIQGRGRPDVTISFEYPRDRGSFGSTLVNGVQVPNPPVCASRDSSGEIDALITTLNTMNLSTRSLWRRTFDLLCADFPSRFPGGCTVQ